MIGKPADINSNPNDVWEQNFFKIKENVNEKFGKELTDDLYDFYVEEIGIEKLVKYLEEQDEIESMNYGFIDFGNLIFKESHKINYNKFNEEDDEDEENNMSPKREYDISAIKSSLLKYFLNELVEEIPINSVFVSKEDVFDFIKTYQIKFLYEVIIPISEIDQKN